MIFHKAAQFQHYACIRDSSVQNWFWLLPNVIAGTPWLMMMMMVIILPNNIDGDYALADGPTKYISWPTQGQDIFYL